MNTTKAINNNDGDGNISLLLTHPIVSFMVMHHEGVPLACCLL